MKVESTVDFSFDQSWLVLIVGTIFGGTVFDYDLTIFNEQRRLMEVRQRCR